MNKPKRSLISLRRSSITLFRCVQIPVWNRTPKKTLSMMQLTQDKKLKRIFNIIIFRLSPFRLWKIILILYCQFMSRYYVCLGFFFRRPSDMVSVNNPCAERSYLTIFFRPLTGWSRWSTGRLMLRYRTNKISDATSIFKKSTLWAWTLRYASVINIALIL